MYEARALSGLSTHPQEITMFYVYATPTASTPVTSFRTERAAFEFADKQYRNGVVSTSPTRGRDTRNHEPQRKAPTGYGTTQEVDSMFD